MGLINRIFGNRQIGAISTAVTDVAEVFTPNATRKMEIGHEAFVASVNQHSAEFDQAGDFLFDRIVNGMNRLPRPLLALGTLALFVFAMIDPANFSQRMEGLALVPDPLWWLLGAIVSFYFGARELHYRRVVKNPQVTVAAKKTRQAHVKRRKIDTSGNAALDDWQAQRSGAE